MTWREAIEATISIWQKRARGEWSVEVCQICKKQTEVTNSSRCGDCPAIRICNGDAFFDWQISDRKGDAKKVLKELLELRKHKKYGTRKKEKKV